MPPCAAILNLATLLTNATMSCTWEIGSLGRASVECPDYPAHGVLHGLMLLKHVKHDSDGLFLFADMGPGCAWQTGSLGHGTFGIVIKALDLRSEPPTEVAIKLLPRGDFVRPLPSPPLRKKHKCRSRLMQPLCTTCCRGAPAPMPCGVVIFLGACVTEPARGPSGEELQDLRAEGDPEPEQPQAPAHCVIARGGPLTGHPSVALGVLPLMHTIMFCCTPMSHLKYLEHLHPSIQCGSARFAAGCPIIGDVRLMTTWTHGWDAPCQRMARDGSAPLPRSAQVFLTNAHLAIAMEYAQGGDLFNYTLGHRPHGRLAEQQGRWIFQQLIIGLDYCHRRVRGRVPSGTGL